MFLKIGIGGMRITASPGREVRQQEIPNTRRHLKANGFELPVSIES